MTDIVVRTSADRARARRNSRKRAQREIDGDPIRERDAADRRRRRARLRELPAEPYTRVDVWKRTNGSCGICGVPITGPWHVDHIVPLAWPDSPGDVITNVQPAHPLCNLTKGHRSSTSIVHASP